MRRCATTRVPRIIIRLSPPLVVCRHIKRRHIKRRHIKRRQSMAVEDMADHNQDVQHLRYRRVRLRRDLNLNRIRQALVTNRWQRRCI